MTTMVQCDGPDCEHATDEPTAGMLWIKVEEAGEEMSRPAGPLHFSSWPCVVRYGVTRSTT